MKRVFRITICILLIAVLSCGLFSCAKKDKTNTEKEAPTVIAPSDGDEKVDRSERFDLTNRVLQFIEENYYDDIDYDDADVYAAYGLVASLGRFNYINPITDFLASGTDGKGFGLLVRNTKYNEHLIDFILEGSPFSEPYEGMKVQRGDELYAIEGERVSGLDSSTYASYIARLPSDKDVSFQIKRGDEFFTVKYRKIQFHFPSCFYINDLPGNVPKDLGYICLRTFDSSTNVVEEFQQAVKSYLEDGNKALILDLRGNGGGSSLVFRSIASALIGENAKAGETLVEVHYAKQDYSTYLKSEKVEYKVNTPIYVLCDGNTASASEALIGTMKAHGTLTALIGQKTLGKGVAQNGFTQLNEKDPGYIIDKIQNDSGETVDDLAYLLQVVIGKYYIYDSSTEGGKYCMHENPFVPDVVVEGDNVIDPDYGKDLFIHATIENYNGNKTTKGGKI